MQCKTTPLKFLGTEIYELERVPTHVSTGTAEGSLPTKRELQTPSGCFGILDINIIPERLTTNHNAK